MVPSGKSLIITGFYWRVVNYPNVFVFGDMLFTQLASINADDSAFSRFFMSPGIDLTQTTAGVFLSGQKISAGVCVGSGTVLCAEAYSVNKSGNLTHSVFEANFYGYLIE